MQLSFAFHSASVDSAVTSMALIIDDTKMAWLRMNVALLKANKSQQARLLACTLLNFELDFIKKAIRFDMYSNQILIKKPRWQLNISFRSLLSESTTQLLVVNLHFSKALLRFCLRGALWIDKISPWTSNENKVWALKLWQYHEAASNLFVLISECHVHFERFKARLSSIFCWRHLKARNLDWTSGIE